MGKMGWNDLDYVPENLKSPDSSERSEPAEVTHSFSKRDNFSLPLLGGDAEPALPQDSLPTHTHPCRGVDPQYLSFLATRILIPKLTYSQN